MEKRLKFRCWHCDNVFSLLRKMEGEPRFIIPCPFCEKEVVVDLAPYRSEAVDVYRSAGNSFTWESLVLPDIIPTSPPEE